MSPSFRAGTYQACLFSLVDSIAARNSASRPYLTFSFQDRSGLDVHCCRSALTGIGGVFIYTSSDARLRRTDRSIPIEYVLFSIKICTVDARVSHDSIRLFNIFIYMPGVLVTEHDITQRLSRRGAREAGTLPSVCRLSLVCLDCTVG
jgi:hypothetical protein